MKTITKEIIKTFHIICEILLFVISLVFNIPIFMLGMFMSLIYYISNRDKEDAKNFIIEIYSLTFGRFIKHIGNKI